MSDLLTAAQAAERLNLSRRQIHRLVESGALPEAHRNPGVTGARLFRRSDVEALAASRSHQHAAAIGEHALGGDVIVEADELTAAVTGHGAK